MNELMIKRYLGQEAASLRLLVKDTVSSTNTVAKAYAEQNEAEGLCVLASHQTAGRGRKGRSFYSPEGTGLYLSLLLRPSISVQDSLCITTLAATAAAEAIEEISEHRAEIKWVNDIFVKKKKVVGILTEGGVDGKNTQKLSYAVMGIGFNLTEPEGGFPKEISEIAGAIFTEEEWKNAESNVTERLAATFLTHFMHGYSEIQSRSYMDEYRKRSMVIGKTVRLMDSEHRIIESEKPFLVVGIGDEAELILKDENGDVKTVSSGEVSIRL